MEILIKTDSAESASHLLDKSRKLMDSLFPAEENFCLSPSDYDTDDITFVIAEVDGVVVGCIALEDKLTYGELKSMYVEEDMRGTPVARDLMNSIESIARAMGITSIKLETGDTLVSAIRFYEKNGYTMSGPFGEYEANDSSIFMTKIL